VRAATFFAPDKRLLALASALISCANFSLLKRARTHTGQKEGNLSSLAFPGHFFAINQNKRAVVMKDRSK
jgi:hypothetical protein